MAHWQEVQPRLANRDLSGNNGVTSIERHHMSVQAYILIQSEIGSSENVVLATRNVPGVLESFEVTGPYDVIVRCEAESVDQLGKFIVGAIQKVPGITRTLTCPVVNI
jgi:DNA-binding Lrp family transcriptional regulator